MTYRLVVTRLAQRDVEEAVGYLMAQAPEQADRLVDELETTFTGVAENPFLAAEVRPGIRFRSLSVFPYGVGYRLFLDRELVEVFAVLHHRRGPDTLDKRLA